MVSFNLNTDFNIITDHEFTILHVMQKQLNTPEKAMTSPTESKWKETFRFLLDFT